MDWHLSRATWSRSIYHLGKRRDIVVFLYSNWLVQAVLRTQVVMRLVGCFLDRPHDIDMFLLWDSCLWDRHHGRAAARKSMNHPCTLLGTEPIRRFGSSHRFLLRNLCYSDQHRSRATEQQLMSRPCILLGIEPFHRCDFEHQLWHYGPTEVM